LERDAGFRAAQARAHGERFQRIIREGQADVAAVEQQYADGTASGVREVAGLAARQTERKLMAQQAAVEMQRADGERLNNLEWAGAIELGIIGTAPSAPASAPAAVPPAPAGPAKAADEFADLSGLDRNVMGLPDAEETGPTQISVEDARTFGLA
jgi:hypothetical protein